MQVEVLNDPLQALPTIKAFEKKNQYFDVVFIDKNMPSLNGFGLFKLIRESELSQKLKVILTSAYANQSDISYCENIGIDALLELPASAEMIQRTLLKAMHDDDTKPLSSNPIDIESELKIKNLSVLVADDSKINRKVCMSMIEAVTASIQSAHDGKQAIKLWQRNHFDIILMDCHMPVMDGIEATQEIRKLEAKQAKNTIIIAITASDIALEQDKCFAAGMDGFIAKPYGPNDLWEVMYQCLSDRDVVSTINNDDI
jgi:CheY-like chemotaxis protein